MNSSDAIEIFAKNEGRRLKFNVFDEKLPNFTIQNNKITEISNYKYHDNAPRLQGFAHLLNQQVLPYISAESKISSAKFGIELHDSNSYLENDIDYNNCLVWSRNKKDNKSILIPDYYQLHNYNGCLAGNVDYYNYISKPINKIGFYGSTTGNRNPILNERISMCIWSVGHRDIIDAYITDVVQMEKSVFLKNIDSSELITKKKISPGEMFKYKILLDIPGNTYSWDRVPMILNSNSLLFRMDCEDYGWYFPLLHNGEHFVSVNKDNMRNMYTYYINNQKEADHIINCANKFVNKFLKSIHAHKYIITMLEEAVYWNSP